MKAIDFSHKVVLSEEWLEARKAQSGKRKRIHAAAR